MSSTTVTVIIPTVLRPELVHAIRSVRTQTSPHKVELIVVVDREKSVCSPEEISRTDGASKVLFTGGGRRAGHARNVGVDNASSPWVAFLDDDDEWLPERLAIHELARSESTHHAVVFASRVMQSVRSTEASEMRPTPDVVIAQDQRVEDYLFRSRKPSIGRAGIFTSTLFVPTSLARDVPWDETLSRHQDWDWLYRLQRDGKARVHQSTAIGAIIWMGTSGSISANSDWAGSLTWARRYADEWHRRTYADFLAGQTLRYATQARSLRGTWMAIREICRSRRIPGIGPIAIGVSGIVPRRLAVEAALRRQSSR